MENKIALKKAACVLIIDDKKKKILGVSRKDNPNDWGLPGGKVEQEDYIKHSEKSTASPEEYCAIRECLEETGIEPKYCSKIFEQQDGEFLVTTFFTESWKGEVVPGEEGKVAWIDFSEILAGSFKEYNKELLNVILQNFADCYKNY